MNRFEWVSARSLTEAAAAANSTVADAMVAPSPEALARDAAVIKAGGMDLLDLMKDEVVRPSRLVHIREIPDLDRIEDDGRGPLRLGALVTLAQIAEHPGIKERYAALASAADHSGHPQVRNVATLGGNLAQRPRCWYFRQAEFHCAKKGGDHCFAIPGEHQYHAIFDTGVCPIVHPSTAATALLAFDARLEIADARGARREVALDDFLVTSSEDVRRENTLGPGEIIAAVLLPTLPDGTRSAHLKQAERESFDWSIADVAAVLHWGEDGRVTRASIVLGAAAPVPWRAQEAEAALLGRPLMEETAREAARAALRGATPLPKNAYKLPMFEAVVRRTIMAAA